jgi:hypothetical protein
MPESWRTRLTRWGFNLHPTYWSTGARIAYIAGDWHEVHIKLPLSWRTRNYVGTIFGGSMYSAVDPIYMIMLIKRLGPEYVVWDKGATVRFLRPGRSTLFARFVVGVEFVEAIRAELASAPKLERTLKIDLTDADGAVHATVEKVLHINRRGAAKRSW